MLKSFRYLLFPFSFLYWLIITVRNRLFDKNILKSAKFNFPVICVGNLALGGTGKTPMVEFILRIIKDQYKTAVISRGYKRKTRGYMLAGPQSGAIDIGDEPMQIYSKFGADVRVAVGEERLVAIPQLLHDHPETEVIILDDAFQHRSIQAGMNIMLTDYGNLFTRDHLLPAGDLRDVKSSSRRAQIIMVTKCPSDITESGKNEITREIAPMPDQKVFFAHSEYGTPYHMFNLERREISKKMEILLVCGIANPTPIKSMLNNTVKSYDMARFRDHHIFTTDDMKEIIKQFETLESDDKIILTTEKDAVRLVKFEKELSGFPIYVLPVRHAILFNDQVRFESMITDFIKSNLNRPAPFEAPR